MRTRMEDSTWTASSTMTVVMTFKVQGLVVTRTTNKRYSSRSGTTNNSDDNKEYCSLKLALFCPKKEETSM